MQIAYQTAKLSYAERRKVGCIIVKDEQIVSFGYNGTPHGFNNECEQHLDGELITKKEVLHAESNAITKLAKSTLTSVGADLYTTTMASKHKYLPLLYVIPCMYWNVLRSALM